MPPLCRLLPRTVKDPANIRTDRIIQNHRSRRVRTSAIKQQRKYKIGLNFQERVSSVHHSLKPSRICLYCNAKLFAGEIEGKCCINEKIKLALTEYIAPLEDLFRRLDNVGNKFRCNIRAYNNIFVFTSMGVRIDENLANGKIRYDLINVPNK
ncbi:3433_t:CDS:2 [Racocetra fulgida]|uniref:3433_t:CDS:1 n=1 Tax=Racocetra fulgida TaxID=60492 RepID=A0A9N9GPY0_9GLOM|nr:3433_t:CDS:2 [Racocetra fulgida]